MNVELRLVVWERINEIDALGKIGENFTSRLYERCDLAKIDRRVRDGFFEPRLSLLKKFLGRELFHILSVHPAQLFNVKHSRGLGDARNLENFGKLGKGKELALGVFSLRAPAEKRHIVENSGGEIALGNQVLIAGVAMALGHLVLAITHDGRAVDIGRDVPAEGFVEKIILRRGGKILAAAHDVGDAHQMVVNDICKVIRGKTVGFQKHLILELLVFDRNVAERHVVERGRALLRDALTDDKGLCGGNSRFCFGKREIPAGADVLFDLLAVRFVRGFFFRFLAEAVVCAALFAQKFCILAEEVAPLRLDIGTHGAAHIRTFIVRQAAFCHGLVDHVDRAVDQTALIGVFDAENELTAKVAGDEPGIECRSQVADMHIARGTGRKAGAGLSLRDARFHLFKKIHLGFLHILSSILHNI